MEKHNTDSMFLSVVVPVRNEAKNLPLLHSKLLKVCRSFKKTFEIIYVENASTDNSLEVLKTLQNSKTIVLRWKPYMRKAQSLAMDAGFKAAKGKYVIYIDADLQIDPIEIPKFVEKLEEGYEVVCGWRQKRKETNGIDLLKPFKDGLRMMFSFFRKQLIYEGVHDPGSAIKGFRREALQHIELYGEMHRFIVALLHWQGYKITEVPVKHYPRKHGVSNYNLSKGFSGFTDLINIFFWRKYSDRPLHLLGVGGLVITAIGSTSLIALLILRALNIIALSRSILPVLAILIIIVGVQMFISGIIADTLARIYYATGETKNYLIKEVIEN